MGAAGGRGQPGVSGAAAAAAVQRAGHIARYLFAPDAILLSYRDVSFPTSRSYLSRYRAANRPV